METAFDTAPTLSELERLGNQIKFIIDAKACAKRIDELTAVMIAVDEAKTALAQAQTEFAAHCAERTAELDERASRLDQLFAEAESRKEAADKRYDAFEPYAAGVRSLDRNTRARMAAIAGMSWEPGFQAAPSQAELDAAVFGGRNDAHFDDDSVGLVSEVIPDTGGLIRTTRTRPPRPVVADR